MIRSAAVRLFVCAGALALGSVLAPQASRSQALSGYDLYRTRCEGCHELYDPEEPRRTRAQWETILTRMVKERGAMLNPQEFAAVLSYLDSFNRPPREVRWVETPVPPRSVRFSGAEGGALPPEWVEVTVGGEGSVPWAVQPAPGGAPSGRPGSAPGGLAPLKPAGAGRLSLLLDNSGLLRNGEIATRLRLAPGATDGGGGIVFGFRSPQQFYGVRLGPADVVLFEVEGGQRALLGRAALATPPGQARTLVVALRGREVRVQVDDRPAPLLVRSLARDASGRVGVQVQGETRAFFESWRVTPR